MLNESISRRTAIKSLGVTALTVPFFFQFSSGKSKAATATNAPFISTHIKIDSDNKTTILIGSSEMGQGIMTGMAQLVAEQLRLDWTKVAVEHGHPDEKSVGKNGYPENPYATPGWFTQVTGGSTSTMQWYSGAVVPFPGGSTFVFPSINEIAATVREMLIASANRHFGGGWSLHNQSQLIKNSTPAPFSNFINKVHEDYFDNNIALPSNPQIFPPKDYVGNKLLKRLDIPSKVDGSAKFGIDVSKNTMSTLWDGKISDIAPFYYAAIVHAPRMGGTIASSPNSSTIFRLKKYIKGAKPKPILAEENAVGVINSLGTYEAFQSAKSVSNQISWSYPTDMSTLDTANIKSKSLTMVRDESKPVTPNPPEGGVAVDEALYVKEGSRSDALTAYGSSAIKIDQVYTLPNLAHACMEVLNCTALVKSKTSLTPYQCEIWAPTQAQDWCLTTAKTILGDDAIVRVNTTLLGGGLGRKVEQDYIAQAVQLAQRVADADTQRKAAAVKLVWSREQDFTNDKYRPSSVIRIRMGASQSGVVSAYIHRNVAPSIGASEAEGSNPEATGDLAGAVGLPYNFTSRSVETISVPNKIPLGYWRSVGESYNTFAIESAIDELARAAGVTDFAGSIQFRINNIPNPADLSEPAKTVATRSRAVLEALKTQTATPAPSGSARGMAFLKGFGSYIAMAIEVAGTTSSIRINRVYIALDCGLRINPDAIVAQMEGGVLHGLSATLWGKMNFSSGTPSASNFDRYRLIKMPETPPVSVVFVDKKVDLNLAPFYAPGGVGETAVPLVAPALANAYARLLGTRKRDLPFN